MRRVCHVFVMGVIAMAMAAGTARPIVLVPMTTAEMAALADWVVRGTVESVTVGWNDQHTMVYTSTTVRVLECYGPRAKDCPGELVVCQPGGRVGSRVCVVPGMPTYREGEDVVLFLERSRNTRFAKHAAEYMPVGAVQGKYSIRKDGRAVRELGDAAFVKTGKPRAGTSLDELVAEIRDAFAQIRAGSEK